jgi:hypothetical protein
MGIYLAPVDKSWTLMACKTNNGRCLPWRSTSPLPGDGHLSRHHVNLGEKSMRFWLIRHLRVIGFADKLLICSRCDRIVVTKGPGTIVLICWCLRKFVSAVRYCVSLNLLLPIWPSIQSMSSCLHMNNISEKVVLGTRYVYLTKFKMRFLVLACKSIASGRIGRFCTNG